MKKRIAFVLDEMYIGGTERALIEMLNAFDYSKYDITLFLQRTSGPFQQYINPNVSVRTWYSADLRSSFLNDIIRIKPIRAGKGLYFRILARKFSGNWVINTHYATRCIPPVQCQPFDCVIAYQYVSPSVVAMALYNIPGKQKVAFVHGMANRKKEMYPFLDDIYLKFDCLFCVSESIRVQYKECFPSSGVKTIVMHNMINTKEIIEKSMHAMDAPYDNQHCKLLTVGRLSPEKGQDLIPESARILADKGYQFKWYLVGDGPMRALVEENILKNDVSNYVILSGSKDNPYPYIRNCDLYIQTSRNEGWGLTVQEAKILQKPIIVTPLPVMAEQIQNEINGLIVDSMTPEAIAEGIKTLLDHPEMVEKFQNALKNESIDNTRELQKLYRFIDG